MINKIYIEKLYIYHNFMNSCVFTEFFWNRIKLFFWQKLQKRWNIYHNFELTSSSSISWSLANRIKTCSNVVWLKLYSSILWSDFTEKIQKKSKSFSSHIKHYLDTWKLFSVTWKVKSLCTDPENNFLALVHWCTKSSFRSQ